MSDYFFRGSDLVVSARGILHSSPGLKHFTRAVKVHFIVPVGPPLKLSQLNFRCIVQSGGW